MVKTHTDPDFLLNFSDRERTEAKNLIDYSDVETLPEVWSVIAKRCPDAIALCNPHAKPEVMFSYTQLYEKIRCFAAALQALGVKIGDRISLISDNSPQWMIADQGILMAGAVDAVRSSQAEREELLYIIGDSGSTGLVLEDLKTFKKLHEGLNKLSIELVILLSNEATPSNETLKVLNFEQFMEIGTKHTLEPAKRQKGDLATLIYTSGTTGKPKGVMLSHGNLMHQVNSLGSIVTPNIGDTVLCILPTWHAYERSCEYFLLSQGCMQIYTNLRSVKSDLKKFQPNYIIAVPRLLESIYEGVQKQFREQPASKQSLVNNLLGISQKYIKARRIAHRLDIENLQPSALQRFAASLQASLLAPIHALGEKLVYAKVREATGGKIKQMVSGGGALPRHIDTFFEIVGVDILVGYGLTETSPVTHVRRNWRNIRGTAGQPIPQTEAKIVDPETRKTLSTWERGLVLLRGPQIMQGYYQNPEATTKAIDSEGWFDSGDLGWISDQNDLVLTGRAKDTIVLTNGENIEPQPIEDACLRSPYIDQIMLVGQDQRCLGALIIPNLEALEKWAKQQNLELCIQSDNVTLAGSQKIDLESKIIQDLFRQELNREVQTRSGYRPDDRINRFKLILEPFSIENGMMTQTLKIRRHVVMNHYSVIINAMFA